MHITTSAPHPPAHPDDAGAFEAMARHHARHGQRIQALDHATLRMGCSAPLGTGFDAWVRTYANACLSYASSLDPASPFEVSRADHAEYVLRPGTRVFYDTTMTLRPAEHPGNAALRGVRYPIVDHLNTRLSSTGHHYLEVVVVRCIDPSLAMAVGNLARVLPNQQPIGLGYQPAVQETSVPWRKPAHLLPGQDWTIRTDAQDERLATAPPEHAMHLYIRAALLAGDVDWFMALDPVVSYAMHLRTIHDGPPYYPRIIRGHNWELYLKPEHLSLMASPYQLAHLPELRRGGLGMLP